MVYSCTITIKCKFTFDYTNCVQMHKCIFTLMKNNYLATNFTKKKFIFIYII